MMKAALLNGIDQPFVVTDIEKPQCNEGEMLIRLSHAALNHRDVWIQKGQYAGLKFPVVVGSDGCGVVEAVGANVSADWLGKEVIIDPSMNWGDNPRVQAKDYVILGLPHQGTLADYITIPTRLVHEKPTHLESRLAAALPLASLTAFRALFGRAKAKEGETVLVTGIGGGVALFAAQFAHAIGCKVYVTSGHDEKLAKAMSLGFAGGANYKETEWYKSLAKESGGFDVVIDGAGGADFARLIDLCKPAARIASYGATAGPWNTGVPAKIFWKQIDLLGSTMGNNEEFAQMVDFVNRYRIVPMVEATFPLSRIEQAAHHMDAGKQFGKIVIEIN